jgi:hypothetical protein
LGGITSCEFPSLYFLSNRFARLAEEPGITMLAKTIGAPEERPIHQSY